MNKTITRKQIVPIFTTQAGSCLTSANWQEAGVDSASFELSSLLMKPGYDVLKKLPDLASYVAWPGQLILNASLPSINSEGRCILRSRYDGRHINHSLDAIIKLIITLKPTMVILPQGLGKSNTFLEKLPESIFPFLPVEDLSNYSDIKRSYGVYFHYDKASSSSILEQLSQHTDKLCYVAGDFSLSFMLELFNHGAQFIESDKPASDALEGNVYSRGGDFSLQQEGIKKQFELIDDQCTCPTCHQQLTRAYLYHLLEQTPLLCQRFLVQHNMTYCQAAL